MLYLTKYATYLIGKAGSFYMKKDNKLIMSLICIIAFGIVSLPLLGNTLFAVEGHDTFFHTQRIWSIKHGLESGQFPVRIYTEIYDGFGYGSPLFYPELFLYFPAVLCMLGIPLTLSYNIFLMVINALTLGLAWYSFSKITDSAEIGLIGALLYELCTYRMLDIYTRSSIGEVIALTFCPLAICGLHLIAKGAYGKWWILTLAFSGLLQSHILSFVMMVVVAAIYIIIRFKAFLNKKAIVSVLLAAIAAVLLNLWFLVPFLAVSGMNVIAMLGTDGFWATAAIPAQIFDALLLSAGGAESYSAFVADVMPKTPGITLLAGAVLALFALLLYKERIGSRSRQMIGYLAAGMAGTWMVTDLFPWKLVQKIEPLKVFFAKYQFIWRFNVVAILFLSVAAACGFYYFFVQEAYDRRKALVLLSLVLCLSSVFFINQYIKQSVRYGNEEVMEKGYMDNLYVVPGFIYRNLEGISSNITDIVFENIERKECEITFDFVTKTGVFVTDQADQAFIEVPITYYPGYQVFINGEEAAKECSIWGVIRIWLPEDCQEGTVQVYFEEPVLWKAANIISCLSCIGFVVYIILQKRKKK